MPSPVSRVARERLRLVAVALLALVSLAAAGINATAAERLQATLDENWRGAYDILVTAEGGELAGLLAPNSLGASSKGMTLEDVEAIRSVAGVDVAAPIGEVIIPMLSTPQAQFTIPKGFAGASEVPQAFRVTVTYLTDDGLGERLISTESFDVVIDETPRKEIAPQGCNMNGYDVTPEEYPLISQYCGGWKSRQSTVMYPSGGGWSGTGDAEGDHILFTLGGGLMSSTRVTLVDPEAERALLGDAGEFLSPLVELAEGGSVEPDELVTWAQRNPSRYADAFLNTRTALEELQTGIDAAELEEWKRLYAANGDEYLVQDFEEPPYVPILGREIAPAPLTLRLDVEAFGDAPVVDGLAMHVFPYEFPANMADGAGEAVGSSTVDVSTMLNPFAMDASIVAWPTTNSDGVTGPPWAAVLSLFLFGTVDPLPVEVLSESTDGVEVRYVADEYVSPLLDNASFMSEVFRVTDDGLKPGEESVFGADLTGNLATESRAGALVGGFSIDEIAAMQSELSLVPLGAYQSVGSTLIAGSSPVATEAVELRPSVSGLGLVSPETVAIASLESASVWGQFNPVNAVRVRVADVGVFGADAIGTIANVAAAIEKLGFTATVVAGSSPTDVTVHVDGYAFGVTDPDEQQTVGPLGAVNQRWSELGAASRVDLAVSTRDAAPSSDQRWFTAPSGPTVCCSSGSVTPKA